MATKCFTYLRTSGDDKGNEKAGIDVQREAVAAMAAKADFETVREFADDGVSGKTPMYARPAGKLLIAALLADGIRTVLCYDAKRIGRTQPAFWSFIGMCRDNRVTVLDSQGTDLTGSVMGGVNGMLAEMDRDATVKRLAEGKKKWRGQRRVEGRWPYGEHPDVKHIGEKAVVERIIKEHAAGSSIYQIAKSLNASGVTTRYGKRFAVTTVSRILTRNRRASP